MIMVKFARSASVGICLYALSVILLFPFNAFAQREYGSSPRGFAFDTQLCYREECDKVANTKYELPCCRELCNWKNCVSNSHDPQAAGRTECQPHYQIYTDCLKKAKASKNISTNELKSMKITYKVFAGKGAGRQPHGTASIVFGTYKTLLDIKGGCGAPDFAQCKIDMNGGLTAYYKDSCDKAGKTGVRVTSGCSKAMFKEYYSECCVQ